MNPPINFEREIGRLKESSEFLRMMHTLAVDIYNRLGAPVNVSNTVVSGGSSGGSSGTAVVSSLTQQYTATIGSNTITLPSGGFSSDNYLVFAVLVGSGGEGAMLLGQPNSQTALNFTYGDIPIAGIIYYDAKLKT